MRGILYIMQYRTIAYLSQAITFLAGTLSPLDMLPKILRFQPIVIKTFPMTLARPSLLPIVCMHGVVLSFIADFQLISLS